VSQQASVLLTRAGAHNEPRLAPTVTNRKKTQLSTPPSSFKQVLFKEGGIGTFYPMYYALGERARKAEAAAAAAAAAQQQQQYYQPPPPGGLQSVQELVHKA
jgi:hypothetical protein